MLLFPCALSSAEDSEMLIVPHRSVVSANKQINNTCSVMASAPHRFCWLLQLQDGWR